VPKNMVELDAVNPALSLYSDRTQAVEPNRAEYEGEDEYDSGTKPLSEEMVAWFKRRL
jgi:hypothetical protein